MATQLQILTNHRSEIRQKTPSRPYRDSAPASRFTLHASRASPAQAPYKSAPFMQNKPNFHPCQMNLTPPKTNRYENNPPRAPRQNKPNKTHPQPPHPLHPCPVTVFFLLDSNAGRKHTRFTLHASRASRRWRPLHLSRTLYKSARFMQNKPNFLDALMNLTPTKTNSYENNPPRAPRQNKPTQPQSHPPRSPDSLNVPSSLSQRRPARAISPPPVHSKSRVPFQRGWRTQHNTVPKVSPATALSGWAHH